MSDEAPDLVGYFQGWKGLIADKEGGLWSPSYPVIWPSGELLAKCNRHEKPPVKGCGCGIYAVKTYEDLMKHQYNWSHIRSLGDLDRPDGVWVNVEIALYGDVIPGAIGWKAEKGELLKVYVPAHKIPLGGLIRKRYGVKLGLIDRFTGKRT